MHIECIIFNVIYLEMPGDVKAVDVVSWCLRKLRFMYFAFIFLGDLQSRWVSGQEQWPAVSSSVPSNVPM